MLQFLKMKSVKKFPFALFSIFTLIVMIIGEHGSLWSVGTRDLLTDHFKDGVCPPHKHEGGCHPHQHCPNKPRKCTGIPGQSCLGGLNDFASFELIVRAGSTFNHFAFPEPVSFGTSIAHSGDAILSLHPPQSTIFSLEPGDYKIAAGVSTFGIPGMQLILSLNDKEVFRWPNTPTTLDDTTFIEFTVIEHVSIPSALYISTTVEIPSIPITHVDTLVNYLTIEKLD